MNYQPRKLIPSQMIEGANQFNYNISGLFYSRGLLTIEMVFPNWKLGEGIFEYLKGFEFNDSDESAIELNVDYIGGYSATKVASRIIHNLWDDEDDRLHIEQIKILAGIIRRRYSPKWIALWQEYAYQSWFENIAFSDSLEHGKIEEQTYQGSIVDSKSGDDTDTFTPTGSKMVTEGGTTNDDITHTGGYTDDVSYEGVESRSLKYGAHSDTDNLANTGSDSLQRTGVEQTETDYTGKTLDSGNSSYTDNVFGFNSTGEDGVHSGKGSGTDGNTRSFENRKDTVKVTYPTPREDKTLYSSNHNRTLTYQEHTDTDDLTYMEGRADKREFTYKPESADKREIMHGKTITTEYLNKYHEETKKDYNSSNTREWNDYLSKKSNSGSDVRDISGRDYRRYSRLAELVAMYDNKNLFPFFEMVYEDVDRVLAVPIFK